MHQNSLPYIYRVAKSLGIAVECLIDDTWFPEVNCITARDTQYRIAKNCEHLMPMIKDFIENFLEKYEHLGYVFYIPKGTLVKGNIFVFGSLAYFDGEKMNNYNYNYNEKGFYVNGDLLSIDIMNVPKIYATDGRDLEL